MSRAGLHRVVIAGGGVAGLEAALALHALAPDAVEVSLLEPAGELVDRPMLAARPFAAGRAQDTPIDRILSGTGVRHVRDRLASVDAAAGAVHTAEGEALEYDSLIVALGARAVSGPPWAATFWPEDPNALSGLLRDLEEGYSHSVAFVIPAGPSWPLPAYELALMTAGDAAGMGQTAQVTVVTPEPRPLAVFGPAASVAVAKLLADHGVDVLTDAHATPHPSGRSLLIRPGDRRLDVDRVIALPRIEGRPIPGLPADADGFLPVDRHCRVRGIAGVYAAGDIADFPVKHGGLAAEMADAAAEDIAARAGADLVPAPFAPVLRGTLLTGSGERRHLRGGPHESTASDRLLWWPPAKVAARHLAPVLAERSGEALRDVETGVGGLPVHHQLT